MACDAKFDVLLAVGGGRRKRFERDLEPAAGHRQLLHRLGHARLELVGGELALCGKLACERAVARLGIGSALGEDRGVRGFGECRDPRLGLGAELRQCLRSNAMLARNLVDRRKALVDARELARIESSVCR
jgi:hypothetical protein